MEMKTARKNLSKKFKSALPLLNGTANRALDRVRPLNLNSFWTKIIPNIFKDINSWASFFETFREIQYIFQSFFSRERDFSKSHFQEN